MHESAEAVIIGAGLAGSAMAHALAKCGRDVVLLDKSEYPRHKACGEFLSQASRQTLGALGLEDAVHALHPAEMTHVRVHTEHGHSLELPLPGPAWGVSRHALDAKLHEMAKAAGVRIRFPITVTRVNTIPGGFLVDGRGRSATSGQSSWQWEARLAVNACGRHRLRAVREQESDRPSSASVGIKSHFLNRDGSPVVDLYFFRGGYVGIAPIEDGRLNVAALLFDFDHKQLDVGRTLAHILANASDRIPVLARRLADTQPIPGTQASAYPVIARTMPRYWNGLPGIGDAVAVVPPFLGGGMAMALRTAELGVPLADAFLAGKLTMAEWKRKHLQTMARAYAGLHRWSGLLERALMHAMLSAWMLRFGAMAPKVAERFVRVIRAGG
jgi:flavin-dependent dehydrogenase